MISEGAVSVKLDVVGGEIVGVELNSTRPTTVSRVLEGKSVEAASSMVPMLFSLCARAQAIAGVTAAEQAQGWEADPATQAMRHWLVVAEQTLEYLWRLLVDLPTATGEAVSVERLASLRQRFAELFKRIQDGRSAHLPGAALAAPDKNELATLTDLLAACLEADVLGGAPGMWRTDAAFEQWLERGETPVARALRHFDTGVGNAPQMRLLSAALAGEGMRDLATRLLAEPAFTAAPQWRGEHPETGALARRRDSPLIAALRAGGRDPRLLRQAARLEELVDAAVLLRTIPAAERSAECVGGGALTAGTGYGWVETARGLLLHALRLADGHVVSYRILAPTEWNFHPQGPLRSEMMGWTAANAGDLERQARLAVLALDPCVGFEVSVHHA